MYCYVSSVMDKMKKLLNSPITKCKNLTSTPHPNLIPAHLSPHVLGTQRNYFGVPLSQILQREGTKVPLLVTKFCHYLNTYGESLSSILSKC